MAIPVEVARTPLVVRPFRELGPRRTIALVWRKRSPLAPALRRLAATIQAAYPGAADPRPGSPLPARQRRR